MLLIGTLAFLVIIALVVAVATQKHSPHGLYEQLYTYTRDMAYDPQHLPDWQQWNSISQRIQTDEDAVTCANEMLKPLNDPYTIALGRNLQHSGFRWECSECVGVGILIAAAYENSEGESCQSVSERTGVSCKYPTIVSVIWNSPAAQAGLRAGDAITAIDGWSTAGQPLTAVMTAMHGQNRSQVTIVIERDGQLQEHTLKRQFISGQTCFSRLVDDDIAYLRIGNFWYWSEAYTVLEAEKLTGARAVVVDLRDNPGGEVLKGIRLSALFMHSGHITTTHTRVPGTDKYRWTRYSIKKRELVEEVDEQVRDSLTGNLPEALFADKKLVILVNENTASSAELFTGALRDSAKAVVLGTTTFGKGVQQSILNFSQGVVLRVTSGKFYFPGGFWVGDGAQNRIGIQPDVVVPPQTRLFDMGSDQDEQLAAAVRYLRGKL